MKQNRFQTLACQIVCNDVGDTGLGSPQVSLNVSVLFWIWINNFATLFLHSSVSDLPLASLENCCFRLWRGCEGLVGSFAMLWTRYQFPTRNIVYYLCLVAGRTYLLFLGGKCRPMLLEGGATSGFWICTMLTRQFELHGAQDF